MILHSVLPHIEKQQPHRHKRDITLQYKASEGSFRRAVSRQKRPYLVNTGSSGA